MSRQHEGEKKRSFVQILRRFMQIVQFYAGFMHCNRNDCMEIYADFTQRLCFLCRVDVIFMKFMHIFSVFMQFMQSLCSIYAVFMPFMKTSCNMQVYTHYAVFMQFLCFSFYAV